MIRKLNSTEVQSLYCPWSVAYAVFSSSLAFPNEEFPMNLHIGMFMPTLQNQATDALFTGLAPQSLGIQCVLITIQHEVIMNLKTPMVWYMWPCVATEAILMTPKECLSSVGSVSYLSLEKNMISLWWHWMSRELYQSQYWVHSMLGYWIGYHSSAIKYTISNWTVLCFRFNL